MCLSLALQRLRRLTNRQAAGAAPTVTRRDTTGGGGHGGSGGAGAGADDDAGVGVAAAVDNCVTTVFTEYRNLLFIISP